MKYTTLKKTDDGSLYSSVRTDDDQPLIVQLNNVRMTEGVLAGEDDVWFTYSGEEANQITTLEQQILEDVKADPETWFSRKVKDKTIESSFVSTVSAEGQFQLVKSPGLRVFDKVSKEIFEEDVTGETLCDIILQLQGVSFFKRSFQVVLKLHQVQVTPVETVVEEVSHDNWTMPEYGFTQ